MITNVQEFKEIIEGEFGITNLKAYGDYKAKHGGGKLTKEEVERMAPENVDSCSFWEYIEKNPELAKDAIAFGVTKDNTIQDANNHNFGLACDVSTLNYLLTYKDCVNMPILDIGAGYGMLRDFVAQFTKLSYFGVDVYPKIPGVQKVAADGSTIPANIMAAKFGVVVCTNVFQHMSVKQRRHYYEQVSKILYPKWGIFSSSHMVITPDMKQPIGFTCGDGKQYCCHYGQYTEIQKVEEVIEDLEKYFEIMTINQRVRDGSVTFHCILKPEIPHAVPLDLSKKTDTIG